jgi:hypothetical protein
VPAGEFDGNAGVSELRHVTTLWVNRLYTQRKRTQIPTQGDVSVFASVVRLEGPLRSLPTKLLKHPDRLQLRQEFREEPPTLRNAKI